MAKTAKAVIGANFGDEGKGLITDFFAAEAGGDAVVVRYNGGAQAGHTVTTPEGQRHVFSHFGAGSFTGAETFLSRFFVCNPLLFMRENEILQGFSLSPTVQVDSAAYVTTPYDMMVNQIVEDTRGDKRHGSCGLGFGETIGRHEETPHHLRYADLFDRKNLDARLKTIRETWMPQRLAALGIAEIPETWRERIASPGVVQKYMDDTAAFLSLTRAADTSYLAQTRKQVIFEGAQGLLLDQARGTFPHVTRSHTGIRNILALAEEAEMDAIDVAYITRAYMTRHGAGPLAHELPQAPYAGIQDKTNVTNTYQGHLRFGWLDTARLARAVADDLSDNRSTISLKPGIAVTCLDQVGEEVTVVEDSAMKNIKVEALSSHIAHKVKACFTIESRGPARSCTATKNELPCVA